MFVLRFCSTNLSQLHPPSLTPCLKHPNLPVSARFTPPSVFPLSLTYHYMISAKSVTKSASPKHNLRTFGKALGLSLETDKDAFDDIRKRLRELMEKHFNINLTMQRQSAASWKNIDAEVYRHSA